jgi:hypothetical protein
MANNLFNLTVRLRDRYSQLSAEVSILNLHALGSLPVTDAFVCHHLHATSTCALLASWPRDKPSSKKQNVRPRDTATLKDLAWGMAPALARGSSPADVLRAVRRLKTRGELTKKNITVPARCVSASVGAAILRSTEEEEALLFPQSFARETRAGARLLDELRRDFSTKAELLCSADVRAALEMPRLRQAVERALASHAQPPSPPPRPPPIA